jgi:glycosyltransferase involved in cell wall biosynthesis
VIREEQLGLTPARLRGIREARGDVLVFVDDDNVVHPDFLEQVLRVAEERPYLGAWSGQSHPRFEEPPPDWTRAYWNSLAIQEFSRDTWSNLANLSASMPLGAGLCVRKFVADYYAELHAKGKRQIVLDRMGTSLVSGGDVDLATCAIDLGYGTGRFMALHLTHLMPANRMKEEYLLRLVEGISYSGVIINSLRESTADGSVFTWKRKVKEFLSFCLMSPRGRRFYLAARRGMKRGQRKLAEMKATGNGAEFMVAPAGVLPNSRSFV